MSCTNPRKERERFHYLKGQPFDDYSRTLKVKSYCNILDRWNKFVITYFETQKDLHDFMQAEHVWKPTSSQSPMKKPNNKSKDTKRNSKSNKEKKLGSKQPSSSTKSRDKSKKDKKRTTIHAPC